MWAAGALCLLAGLVVAFLVIARKGRKLRRAGPIPPEAQRAFVTWVEAGKNHQRDVSVPFYFGKSPESEVLLPNARANFEICIFYHNHRFAIQALSGAGDLLVNGEEKTAGYLFDGDTLQIAQQTFIFHCW
ncbi:MAG TPA: FHA domain-containing protein [Acidobacteriota bacterium]|nr:FHA domain-containing protein [Acidobacteriota bacterium]